MSRELGEDIWDNVCSSDDEGGIEELVANSYPQYPSYQSDQEEIDIQIGASETTSNLGDYGDINDDSLFLEEVYSPINRFIDLVTINYFNGQNHLLEQNGFRINEDFGEVIVIGEDIILIDKNLGDFLIITSVL